MKFINTGKVKIGQHYARPPQRIVFSEDELFIQKVLLGEPLNQAKWLQIKIVVAITVLLVLRIIS